MGLKRCVREDLGRLVGMRQGQRRNRPTTAELNVHAVGFVQYPRRI